MPCEERPWEARRPLARATIDPRSSPALPLPPGPHVGLPPALQDSCPAPSEELLVRPDGLDLPPDARTSR